MAKLYSYVRGSDILSIKSKEDIPIIEGILNYGDYVLFTAEEKVGKTILSQQLCCSMSSGQDFLGIFPVSKPCKVWYMFNEVRMSQIQDRFIRMCKAVKMDTDNITLIPFKFRFNTATGHAQLQEIIKENAGNYPDVLILDALYKAVKGSLKDDNVINDFNHVWNGFASAMGGCARIVVHHLTKPSKDANGKFYSRNDKDSFGSAFLLADIDHVLRLEKWGDDPLTKERILKCETQRSGDIVESIRLRMMEPDPLYYEYITLHTEDRALILEILNKHKSLTVNQLLKYSKVGRTKLYDLLKQLVVERIVEKSDSRPVLYGIRN